MREFNKMRENNTPVDEYLKNKKHEKTKKY